MPPATQQQQLGALGVMKVACLLPLLLLLPLPLLLLLVLHLLGVLLYRLSPH